MTGNRSPARPLAAPDDKHSPAAAERKRTTPNIIFIGEIRDGLAVREAIAAATVIEKTVDETVTVLFEYPFMNDVMRIVKEEEPEMLEQSYDMDCRMTLRIRKSAMPKLRARLEKVETLRFEEA